MTDLELKRKIEFTLKAFATDRISQSALSLFDTLGYNTNRQNPFLKKTSAEFEENFGHVFAERKFNKDKARFADWKWVDLIFQLSRDELSVQQGLFDTRKVRWEGEDKETVIETYLFFAIELSGAEYSRTAQAQMTREMNKVFPMPVMIVFKHGRSLTFSIINRRLHKKNDQKDVLEKVTLIKDISIDNPHRAHIEILYDLSLTELKRVHKFTNFVELHQAWQKTLDTKELNKRFYLELSNWYFWAMDHVSFPDDAEKNESLRNATSLIRLITRIIFIWFIKEKDLVPDVLFDRKELPRILKAFNKNKKSDSYYRAILQNLFFGTLNQRMNERGFARDGSFQENRNNYGVKNLFRYSGDFAIDEKEALSLFKDIPFLNGGLFDCLDKENDEDKVIYSDGFSRNPKKQAVVPDFLFFGEENDYDLNAIYGTRNKRYKVKGLFNILSAYKFTVAENTPVEEEIALDPELLGRVFENLLASYNPETQTTARKQTGSFYTPREIVNYMVDESLKAYLKQKLETEMKPEDADAGLEILFSYTEKEHAFTGPETKTLIHAIDDCKILDPACGSGAFPMGVLHKFVHILHKLDPHNEKWQERQIAKARQIDDPSIREQSIADIEAAFTNNELDYGRKLYLIENCIYGVDIQPIAVQIAKLRFFISLVVDQKKQPAKKNLGILSLPNLETKFVAANTLIGLDKPQTGGQISIKNPEIEKLEDDLKALRHQYFNARTRKEKLTCQKKDKELRRKIAALLEKDGWNKDAAHSVAAFDPYDQNASSPFFDPEWMFGTMDGFDVVIGNPPYIVSKGGRYTGSEFSNELIKYFRRTFKTAEQQFNTYTMFIELTKSLLTKSGISYLIVPNTFLANEYSFKLRDFLVSECNVYELFNTGLVFEAASVETVVIGFGIHHSDYIKIRYDADNYSFLKTNEIVSLTEDKKFLIKLNPTILSLIQKMNQYPKVKKFAKVWRGLTTGNDSRYITDTQKTKRHKPLIIGGNIEKYGALLNEKFVEYLPEELDRARDERIFLLEEKLVSKFVGTNLTFTYDSKKYYVLNSGCITELIDKSLNIKYLLALLNSSILNFYFSNVFTDYRDTFPIMKSGNVECLPLPDMHMTIQMKFCNIVDFILATKRAKKDSFFFICLIDAMVYELYFPNEIKAADAEVLKHLTNTSTTPSAGLPELKDEWPDDKKLKVVEKVYQELSNPQHPVSIAMARQKTIPEVRIIEGLDV